MNNSATTNLSMTGIEFDTLNDLVDRVVYVDVAQSINSAKTFTVIPSCAVVPSVDSNLTNKTYVDTKVSLTGDETIAGIKTFSSVPICSTQPTTDSGLSNKQYVDKKVSLTENETIAGEKTFSDNVKISKSGDCSLTVHSTSSDPASLYLMRNSATYGADDQIDYRLYADGGRFKLDSAYTGGVVRNWITTAGSGAEHRMNLGNNSHAYGGLDLFCGTGDAKLKLEGTATTLANTNIALNGITTFNNVPICSTQPTTDTGLSNKIYVDNADTVLQEQIDDLDAAIGTGVVHITGTEEITGSKTFKNNNFLVENSAGVDKINVNGTTTTLTNTDIYLNGSTQVNKNLYVGDSANSQTAQQTPLVLRYKMTDPPGDVRSLNFRTPIVANDYDAPFVIHTNNALNFQVDDQDVLILKSNRDVEIKDKAFFTTTTSILKIDGQPKLSIDIDETILNSKKLSVVTTSEGIYVDTTNDDTANNNVTFEGNYINSFTLFRYLHFIINGLLDVSIGLNDTVFLFITSTATTLTNSVINLVGTTIVRKAQNTGSVFTTPHLKLEASIATNVSGKTSIAMATSTSDNYGISLSANRYSVGATPEFTINTHNNSATGDTKLTIKPDSTIIANTTVKILANASEAIIVESLTGINTVQAITRNLISCSGLGEANIIRAFGSSGYNTIEATGATGQNFINATYRNSIRINNADKIVVVGATTTLTNTTVNVASNDIRINDIPVVNYTFGCASLVFNGLFFQLHIGPMPDGSTTDKVRGLTLPTNARLMGWSIAGDEDAHAAATLTLTISTSLAGAGTVYYKQTGILSANALRNNSAALRTNTIVASGFTGQTQITQPATITAGVNIFAYVTSTVSFASEFVVHLFFTQL